MSTKKMSRRDFLRLAGLTGGAAALAACAPKLTETSAPATEAATEAVATEAPVVKSAEELLKAAGVPMPGSPDSPKGWKTDMPNPPAGYPLAEPITITTARPTDSEVIFPDGDGLDNNVWARTIATLFGVTFVNKMTWVDGDEQMQKYNLAMASNDLPDIMHGTPAETFQQMVEADMLLELGPIWDQYASPKWKAIVEAGGDTVWRRSTVNGKRYGIPGATAAAAENVVLWVRKDWLDKLGLKAPETWQDVRDVAIAFTEAKLGGPDTYGLLANQEYHHSWYGSLDSLWGGYGIATNYGQFGWSKAADGSLEYGGVKPEAKEVLTMLAQWYKDGVFRKDFYAVSPDELAPDLASGRCGLQFNPVWGANRDSVTNTGADWIFLNVPAGPKGRFQYSSDPWLSGVNFCCPKNFKYAKEWIEYTNWRIEFEETVGNRMHGWEGVDYAITDGSYEKLDPNWIYWTVGPRGTRANLVIDPLYDDQQRDFYLTEWEKLPEDQRDAFQAFQFTNPVTVLRTKAKAFAGKNHQAQAFFDLFSGNPTPTMEESWSNLMDMEKETFLSIIIGGKPIEAYDEFVANWKSGGGDQITVEVNEWWKSIQ
jgi:putative aldouronate transport system substrate-binding protein